MNVRECAIMNIADAKMTEDKTAVGGSARALGQTLVRRGGALVPCQHPLQAFPAFLFFAVHGASALLSVRVFRSYRGIFQELSGEFSAASRAGHSNASAG